MQKLVILTFLAATTAAAADPTPAKPAPTDPKLAQLVGRWEAAARSR